MALETQARCGTAEYGNVARANFQQIEARLVALEAEDVEGDFRPENYGAVADGVTDDTAAIQAAIAAAWAVGGRVVLSAASYAFTQLVLPAAAYAKSLAIVGQNGSWYGYGGTRLLCKSPTLDAIICTDSNSYYRLENFSLVGLGVAGTGCGIKFANATQVPRVHFENLDIDSFTGACGLWLDMAENSTLKNVSVSRCSIGMKFTGAFNGCTLINPIVNLCDDYGMYVDDSTSVAVLGGIIQSNVRHGLYGIGMINWTFSGTHFENNNTSAAADAYTIDLETDATKSCQSVNFHITLNATAGDKIKMGAKAGSVSPLGIVAVVFKGIANSLTVAGGVTMDATCQSCHLDEFKGPGAVVSDSGYGLWNKAAGKLLMDGTITIAPKTGWADSRTVWPLTIKGSKIGFGTAAPTGATDAEGNAWTSLVGDLWINTGASGPMAWKCTVAANAGVDAGTWVAIGFTNPMSAQGDIIYGGTAGVATRLIAGASGTVLKGGTAPSWAGVTEADLSLSAVATADSSSSKHGLLPQLSNNATQFLNGQGNWVTPLQTLPKLTYSAAGAVDVAMPPGANATCYLVLQDNTLRSFTGTLSWAFANGAADLGLDTGNEASSTWYYLYLVPNGGNDSLLTVRASVTSPTTGGPTGYTNYRYIGAFYNDSGSNIVKFFQQSSQFFYYDGQIAVSNGAAGASDGAPVKADLAAFVPATATAVQLGLYVQAGAAYGNLYVWVSGEQGTGFGGTGAATHFFYAGTSAGGEVQEIIGLIPLPGAKELYYQRQNTTGVMQLWVKSWIDSYLA